MGAVSRNQHILSQRQAGRKILAVLPIHYPKEILTAMNILAVEMWGPPGPARGPDAGRIQTYVCAVVRNALAFMASGGADEVDAVLFPHTCDSIQGLATVAPDLGGWDKPAFRFIHAHGDDRPSARRFIGAEFRALISRLEEFTGSTMDDADLVRAVDLHRTIDARRSALLSQRAQIKMGDRKLYDLLRRGEYLWPEDHLRELDDVIAAMEAEKVQAGAPVLVTGIVPEPMTILDALNEAGAWIAADDYAAIGRRINTHQPSSSTDPVDALVDLYFTSPPCSTRQSHQVARADYLEELFDLSGAAGVIIHTVKFCEPELFDVPVIRRRFESRGIPVLTIESELESELSAQTVTRIEAFVEMLGSNAIGRSA
jgi:benzoyl-CoA reductase/2-hydroxyglutaryl-CoA dehydratase subunit BcrC/BadD/HgdB